LKGIRGTSCSEGKEKGLFCLLNLAEEEEKRKGKLPLRPFRRI